MEPNKELKFSDSVAAKYDISPALNPQVTHFPAKYGSQKMDLSNVEVRVVDAFVEKYNDQDYFKLKSKSVSAPEKVKP
jgi:hypothetical protein